MISELTSTQVELKERLRFETLIAELSSKFVNLPAGEVDREIMEAQRRICETLGLDFSTLWQRLEEAADAFSLTHFYTVHDGPQPTQRMHQDQYPWARQQLLQGRVIQISSLGEMPPEAERDRETLRQLGIKSNLALPLTLGRELPVGILGLGTTQQERDWPDALVKRLQLIAQIFTNALARKRTELTLHASERRLSRTVVRLAAGADLAGLGYYEVNLGDESPFVFIDDRFHEISGVSPGQQPGLQALQFWMEHLHPDDRPRVLAEREELHAGTVDRISIEYRYLHPAKGPTWIHHLAGVAVRDADGRAVRTFGVVRDITEQKRVQEALQASEEVSRATFEQAAVGIAHVAPDGRWLRVNDKLCAIVGYSREELVQLSVQDITHPDDLAVEFTNRGRVLAGEIKSFSKEKRYVHKDRSLVWVNLTVSLVRTATGEPKHFISVIEDITPRRQAEAEVQRQRDELAHVARLSTMGELAASVAHEVNQPLGAILRNAEAAQLLLQSGQPDLEELRAIVTDIRDDDERAGKVIDRMRALLRRQSPAPRPLDLSRLAEEVVKLVRSHLVDRHIRLEKDVPADLPLVRGDRVQLQQVLLNLILNGIDAMDHVADRDRHLAIRARLGEHRVIELAVSDSGTGIPPEIGKRIFEPLFTNKTNGMGMGLSISRKIVEVHGGRIWAENNATRGATFRFTLPVAEAPDHQA